MRPRAKKSTLSKSITNHDQAPATCDPDLAGDEWVMDTVVLIPTIVREERGHPNLCCQLSACLSARSTSEQNLSESPSEESHTQLEFLFFTRFCHTSIHKNEPTLIAKQICEEKPGAFIPLFKLTPTLSAKIGVIR